MTAFTTKPNTNYAPETVGSRMSTNVPIFHKDDLFGDVLNSLTEHRWDSVRTIYVTDEEQSLLGIVDIAETEGIKKSTSLESVMKDPASTLHPDSDQEKAVFIAIRNDVVAIPVIDKHGALCGAITGHTIIDIMHEEHIEDVMLGAGVRGKDSNIFRLATERTALVVRSRSPWLILGLFIGIGLGLIASFFEETLQSSIALAYFIPVVTYIADSVGTQSSTITVRALATIKIRNSAYLLKELFVGVSLGAILGVLGAIGAYVISQSAEVALVVGLALLSASTIASVLASAVPMSLRALGKDPALGSGPLATALQDIISLLVYFLFAVLILG